MCWGLFYDPRNGLSWWISHEYLKRMCIWLLCGVLKECVFGCCVVCSINVDRIKLVTCSGLYSCLFSARLFYKREVFKSPKWFCVCLSLVPFLSVWNSEKNSIFIFTIYAFLYFWSSRFLSAVIFLLPRELPLTSFWESLLETNYLSVPALRISSMLLHS